MKFFCVALLLAVANARPQSDIVQGEYSLFLNKGVASSALSHLLSGKITSERMSGNGRTYIILNNVNDELAERISASPLVKAFSQSTWVHLDTYDNTVEAVVTYDPTEVTTTKIDNCNVQSPPSVGNIWHLARLSSQSRDPITTSDNFEYDGEQDGNNSDVAIFDTGIDLRHPEFAGGRAEHTFLASNLASHGYEDIHGHGTHVAGLAGGSVYGSAKRSHLLNYKVLGNTGSGSTAGITEGIVHCHARMPGHQGRRQVINMSLSGGAPNAAQEQALEDFVHDGGFVLASAGNNGGQTSTRFPAGYDVVIAVGASDINNNWASFSNFGPATDNCGPGVSTFAAGSVHSSWCGPGNENCVVALSGTSMSCPVTAGAAARGTTGNQQALRAHFRTLAAKHGILNIAANQDPANTANILINKLDC